MSLQIELPLPPKDLSPNRKVHWGTKAKAVRRYRRDAMIATRAAMCATGHAGGIHKAMVTMRFYFEDRRTRDRDNLLASMKAAIDGMVDAGLIYNDSGFTFGDIQHESRCLCPRVVVLVFSELYRNPVQYVEETE